MKIDGTLVLLAAGGFLLLSSRGGTAGLVALPDGRRIGPDGTLYNAAGQVIGRSTPTQYVQARAAQGRAQGEPVMQTLSTIKSLLPLGTSLYATISQLFSSPAPTHAIPGLPAGALADILRDRIIEDPGSATLTDAELDWAGGEWDVPEIPEPVDDFWGPPEEDVDWGPIDAPVELPPAYEPPVWDPGDWDIPWDDGF